MRELKAGLGLVFGTLIGWLYFILVLLMWIFVTIFSPNFDFTEISKGGFEWLFLYWTFWAVGISASQLATGYRNVLSCGGLFCVPDLAKGMKRFSIIAGFVLAFLFTLPWFVAKWPQERERYVGAVIFFTLLAASFWGRCIPSHAGRKRIVSLMIRALWVAIFIRILCVFFLKAPFFEGWPAMLAAGIFLCVIYCWPYKDKQIRSAHRQLAVSTTDINERPQQAKMRISPNVERFFIGRLNRCSQKHKYLWGAIYLCLGRWLSRWRKIFLLLLGLIILSGFMPPLSQMIIVFIIILAILSGEQNIKLPVHSQMLVEGGRRQRMFATLASAIGASITIGSIFFLISIITHIIALIITPFVFRDQTVTFTPLTIYSAYVVFGIIPAIFGLELCNERAPLLTGFVVIVLSIPAIILISSIVQNPVAMGIVPIALIVISCWAFLIFVSRSICYGKDLILQTDKI